MELRVHVTEIRALDPGDPARLVHIALEADPTFTGQQFTVWVPPELTDIREIEEAAIAQFVEDLAAMAAAVRAAVPGRARRFRAIPRTSDPFGLSRPG